MFFNQGHVDKNFPRTAPDKEPFISFGNFHFFLTHSIIGHQGLHAKGVEVSISNQRHSIRGRFYQSVVGVFPNQMEFTSNLNKFRPFAIIGFYTFEVQLGHLASKNVVGVGFASPWEPKRGLSLHSVHTVRSNGNGTINTHVSLILITKDRVSRTFRITGDHLRSIKALAEVRWLGKKIYVFVFEKGGLHVRKGRSQDNLSWEFAD